MDSRAESEDDLFLLPAITLSLGFVQKRQMKEETFKLKCAIFVTLHN